MEVMGGINSLHYKYCCAVCGPPLGEAPGRSDYRSSARHKE